MKKKKDGKTMKRLLKKARILMAVIGFMLIYSGISTSDYYVMELGQAEPANVWKMIVIGFLLIVPSVIHLIQEEMKVKKYVQDR